MCVLAHLNWGVNLLATRTNAVTEMKCESKELEEQFAQKWLALAKMESQEDDLCFKVKESDFLQLVWIISNQFGMCGFQIVRKKFFCPVKLLTMEARR